VTAVHVGAVRTVRSFRVTTDGRLLSTTPAGALCGHGTTGGFYEWRAGPNTAACRRSDHSGPVPGEQCRCGFYGFADCGALLRSDVPGSHDVMAVVALTGRVIPALRGARGQYARIEALWLSRRAVARGLLGPLCRRYPLTAVYANRDAMFAEFPLSRLPGQRLRHGPSAWLLALQTLYFCGTWILPMLLAPGGSADSSVDRWWGFAGAGLAVLGSLAVPALRQCSRGWWSSGLLAPVLFAAVLVTPGIPGFLLALTLLGVTLAGVVCEGALFLATKLRVGRRLSVLDLHRDEVDPHPQRLATDGG
jgi:hypothetical protein